MRTLSFEPDDRKYERIYAALVMGRPLKDRKLLRKHGEVCDAMEGIGQLKPAVDGQTGEPRDYRADEVRFYVTVAGGTLTLEEDAYDLIGDRVRQAIEDGIHPSLSRDFDRALAWLEGLPRLDPNPASQS